MFSTKLGGKITMVVRLMLLMAIVGPLTIGCGKGDTVSATFETSKGTITLELYEKDAPKTVASSPAIW